MTPLPRAAMVLLALASSLLSFPVAHAGPAATDDSSPRAARALDQAEAVLDGGSGDATLALRDLALLKPQLDGADRAAAERILGRPSSPGDEDTYGTNPETVICSAVVCVHYVVTGPEATSPTFAQTTLNTVSAVHRTYVGAGYRAPKPDGDRGGSALPDVYLANIGDRFLYGYCSSDERAPEGAARDRWAFCVLDNDYARDEFPSNTPVENLQVTAAHEYFHLVQFAYDFAEDDWFLEATAAWVEDELYDDVNDNVQFLRSQSPLRQSRVSMDRFGGSRHYGAWIFFRYLSERFPAEVGGMPTVVRDILRKTDAADGGPDLYSWRAVARVLKARGTTAPEAFAGFAAANRRPRATYDEGASQRYPKPPVVDEITVKGLVRAEVKLDHLSSASYRFVPAETLAARSWKLRLGVDMLPAFRGSAARVTTYFTSGAVEVRRVRLGEQGNGARAVPFSHRLVSKVEITLVNASGRFDCWVGSPFSCSGAPKDDNLPALVSARPFRG